MFARRGKGWRILSSSPAWAQGTERHGRWGRPWRSWWPWVVDEEAAAAAAAAVVVVVVVARPVVGDAALGGSMSVVGRTLRGRSGEVEPYRRAWYDGRNPGEQTRPLQTFGGECHK